MLRSTLNDGALEASSFSLLLSPGWQRATSPCSSLRDGPVPGAATRYSYWALVAPLRAALAWTLPSYRVASLFLGGFNSHV